MMTSKTDFTDMYKTLDKIERGDFWQYIGQKIKAKVKKLMTDGIDVNGVPYEKYNTKYSNWKVNVKGRSAKPNLQLTSLMWKSIQARHTSIFFEVYITGKDENQKAEWNNDTRNFMNWGVETYKEFDKSISEYLRLEGF